MQTRIKRRLLRQRTEQLVYDNRKTGMEKETGKVCARRVAAVHNLRSQRVLALFSAAREEAKQACVGGDR